jgi:hypothetical protein
MNMLRDREKEIGRERAPLHERLSGPTRGDKLQCLIEVVERK